MLTAKVPEIKKTPEELKRLSRSERVRLLYESREKAILDEQARKYMAHKEGLAEGERKKAIEDAPRVAFLLRDAGEGGAERSSLRLANGLARSGYSVRLLFLKAAGPLLASADPSVETAELGRGLRSFPLLTREMNRADFVLPVYTSMRALLAKALFRTRARVVLSQRNMFTMDRGLVQTRLRFLRCRLLYPHAGACVCVSRGVADEMRTLGLLPEEKIHVVYNPVVTDELLTQAETPPNHPWFGGGAPPVVLGAGRLGDQKDFATLIRAFALAARERKDLRLLILGEGRQRPALEKLIRGLGLADRASLPGYAVNPYSCMKRAALFVLTSRFEGFGNVVAEALACGCNVVSTDCRSGPSEILDGGKYGRLARVGDPEDVARQILAALADPLPSALLRERASFFSESRAVEGWRTVFERI
ncbi:MAG: glycosyltransferase [Synergistaceae bacterium]|jgi:glycosyltransferase involved in cell wall biosynthesis|nr:glycosyltransferase [Synergistaceae bacterium]